MIRFLSQVAVALLAIPVTLSVLYNFSNPASTLMLHRLATGQRVERVWTPLSEVSPALVRTVVASEDARFCTHNGIDITEMRNVVEKADDLEDLRGTSTITMQVVKNLFLWQRPEIPRKVLEVPLALWLDLVMSKQRILEIYLNIAEWGPNGTFGVGAAARDQFGLAPSRLNADQAARLAVMLPNPARRSAGAPSPGMSRLADRLQARVPREPPDMVACVRLHG
ncbi:biosynthetic peptidoglycan transglycosylase [Xanthobacter sp. V4C-4]|uniref:biosynthetic peptidoglycan transglycosylase n=1 Tax=Xanthobacter cornucopiae TaxID=3119924 RepID=UPI00372C553A